MDDRFALTKISELEFLKSYNLESIEKTVNKRMKELKAEAIENYKKLENSMKEKETL